MKNSKRVEIDLPRVAVHEAGHAIVAFCCSKVVSITSANIDIDHGSVIYIYSCNKSAKSLYAQMVISLAGLASELINYNKCNGIHAEKDLQNTLDCLDKISIIDLSKIKLHKTKIDISKMYSRSFTDLEKRILNSAYYDSRNIIKSFGEKYYKLISLLLSKNKVSESDMENILGSRIFIKMTGQTFNSDLYFIYPRTKTIIERIKQWNNNLFQKLQKFLTKSIRMLNS